MTNLREQHHAQVRDMLAIWKTQPAMPWGPLMALPPLRCGDAGSCRGDALCRCRDCKPPLYGQTPASFRAATRRRLFIGLFIYAAAAIVLAVVAAFVRLK